MDFTTHSGNMRCYFYVALLQKQSLVFYKHNGEILLIISWVCRALMFWGFVQCFIFYNKMNSRFRLCYQNLH